MKEFWRAIKIGYWRGAMRNAYAGYRDAVDALPGGTYIKGVVSWRVRMYRDRVNECADKLRALGVNAPKLD